MKRLQAVAHSMCITAVLSCAPTSTRNVATCDSPPDTDEYHLRQLVRQAHSDVRGEWTHAVEELGTAARTDDGLRAQVWSLAKVNTVGMKFARIEPGTFTMGPGEWAPPPFFCDPAHRVTISKPYFLSATEVTNFQFDRVFPDHQRDERISPHGDCPAVDITWDRAVEFCSALSKREGVVYRLPTEAEWEYACRAGSTSRFCFGDDAAELVKYAWYGQPYEAAARVAPLKPNAWGLYDMHGNALEWCYDWFRRGIYMNRAASVAPVRDPKGPTTGRAHVLRGGYWPAWNAEAFTSTRRSTLSLVLDRPLFFTIFDRKLVGLREAIGFRVVREID